MKPEDAIELLDTDISNIGIDRKGYAKGVSYVEWGRVVVMAKAALAKQIPKEPIDLTEGHDYIYGEVPEWKCKSCGERMKKLFRYCPGCGQRLEVNHVDK